jgi:tripartite-type tricarboxylate transporter receptor subunit TctC
MQAIHKTRARTRRDWMAQAGAWLLGCSALAGAPALAQDEFPNKPVRIVVPYGAGGSNDTMARIFAKHLSDLLKQKFYVENKPGAGGVIGAQMVANSPADGYTLPFVGGGSMTPVLIKNLKFNLLGQLDPLVPIARGGMTIMVSSTVPAKTFPEFVEWAKAQKGQVNYSYTAGSVMLATEMLRSRTGFEAVGVPYKGSGNAITAMLSGDIHLALDTPLKYIPMIKDGRLRALAHGGQERTPVLPDVPTLAELGYDDLQFAVSFGAWVPKNTPAEIVNRLNVAFNQVLKRDDVRQRLTEAGMSPTGGPPEGHRQQIAGEQAWWARAAKQIGYEAQ